MKKDANYFLGNSNSIGLDFRIIITLIRYLSNAL